MDNWSPFKRTPYKTEFEVISYTNEFVYTFVNDFTRSVVTKSPLINEEIHECTTLYYDFLFNVFVIFGVCVMAFSYKFYVLH